MSAPILDMSSRGPTLDMSSRGPTLDMSSRGPTLAQRDATLRDARVSVLRVAPQPDGTVHAWLDDSVLYAEGGGQPCDHGTLDGVPVRAVRATPEGVLHVLDAPVAVGEVRAVVDWARRFDHMQQHTAQHLITAVAQDRFGWATTSFHLHPLGPDNPEAMCDIELDADITAVVARVGELEDAVNAAIRADHPVSVELRDAGDLPADVRSRGLPDGHTGPVRLVSIDGLDRNTCGGTHVGSTAELQAVALLGAERIRGGTRLVYVAGGRVLTRLRTAEARIGEACALLSRGPAELAAGVSRLLDDAKAASRSVASTEAELAELLGAALAARPADGGPVALHRDGGDLAFLNRIASAVSRADPARIVWLTAGAGPDGVFLLAGPAARIAEVRERVLAALGARGGGPPGRIQGKVAHPTRHTDAIAALLR